MARIESWFEQDLKKPVKVQMISGNLFSADVNGNLIGVRVLDNGSPATLGGTVAANVIRPDGGTIAVAGTLSGNEAYVILPDAAYAVPGNETIVLKITDGEVVTTLLALVVTVYRSTTDEIVDPGSVIPSIQTLIATIETAVASIPADYSGLWTTLAPAYSTSSTYAVGQYVTYDGKMYRCISAISSGESWTAAHWSEVKIGNEISDLKSALSSVGVIEHIREAQKLNIGIHGITHLPVAETGDVTISTDKITHTDNRIDFFCPSGYRYLVLYYSSTTWATENYLSASGWKTGAYSVPANSDIAVIFQKNNGSSAFSSQYDQSILEIKEYDYAKDVQKYIEHESLVFKIRESQRINIWLNGITHVLDPDTQDTRIITDTIFYADSDIYLSTPDGYRFNVVYYTTNTWATENYKSASGWITSRYKIKQGSYFVIQFEILSGSFGDPDNQKYLLNIDNRRTLYHIIVTGQSLAVGAEGNPAITVTTPMKYIGECYQFNGGSRPLDGQENDTMSEEIAILDNMLMDFTSLCERTSIITVGTQEDPRHGYRGETICSSMGYYFNELTSRPCLVSNHGFGGHNYNELKKGTVAYNNSIRAIKHAKEICDRYNWRYVVYGIAVVLGEADQAEQKTAEMYKGYMKAWQNDYDADIKEITGQTETVQMFLSQTAASGSYSEYATVPNGTFLACIEDADIHLVGPQYQWPITYASIHMNNMGYRTMGEFFGHIVGRAFNGSASPAIYPTKSVLSGTTITIEFNHFGSLQFNTTHVAAVSDGNYGFALVDDENGVSITNVTISNDKVVITLSGTPSNGAKISYAYKRLADEVNKIGSQEGVRGNLTSDWGWSGLFDDDPPTMLMWCSVFCVPVNWEAT